MVHTQRPPTQTELEIASSDREPLSPPVTGQSKPTLSFLKTFLLMTTGGITVVTLLILVGIWRAGSSFFGLIEDVLNAPPPTPKVSVPTMVVNQIQGVTELTTAIFTMESIVPTEQDRKLGNLTIGKTQLLYIAQGEVRAGVDLNRLTASDVSVDPETNSVVVKIPPAEILDYNLDVTQSRVYDYNRGFLNLGPDVAPQLQTLAQQKTLANVVSAACERGILDQARDRAEMTIEELLTNSGYSEVTVISEVSPTCGIN